MKRETMTRRRQTAQQIITNRRQADVRVAAGRLVAPVGKSPRRNVESLATRIGNGHHPLNLRTKRDFSCRSLRPACCFPRPER